MFTVRERSTYCWKKKEPYFDPKSVSVVRKYYIGIFLGKKLLLDE